MDLDRVKKSWQETRLGSIVDEDKIQRMIDNKGKSAYNNLIKVEKSFFVYGTLVYILLIWAHYCIVESRAKLILFSALFLVSIIWQIYKYNFLRKLDVENSSITAISRHFITYVKFIMYEYVVALIVFFILMIGLNLDYFPYLWQVNPGQVILFNVIIAIFTVGLAFFVYKRLYQKNIKRLARSLREVEEFEMED